MNKKLIHIIILIAVALLAVTTHMYWQNTNTEFVIAAICIVLAGIPHGALDHLVAGKTRSGFRLLPYLLLYLTAIGLYLLVWWWVPGIAYVFFLIITAWHFGETDLTCFGSSHAVPWRIALYGLAVTMWLLMHDTPTLLYWTRIISKESQLAAAVVRTLSTVPNLLWLVMVAALLLLRTNLAVTDRIAIVLFIAFLYLLQYTSLITGFVLYFTGWHSMNALLHIRKGVFEEQPLRFMLQKAWVPTLGAISFLAVIIWVGNGTWLQHNGLPALFILLSVLTLPHMTEMHRLYTYRKVI